MSRQSDRILEWGDPMHGDRSHLLYPVKIDVDTVSNVENPYFTQLFLSTSFAAQGLNRASRVLYASSCDGDIVAKNAHVADLTFGGKVTVDVVKMGMTISDLCTLLSSYDLVALAQKHIPAELIWCANSTGTVITNHSNWYMVDSHYRIINVDEELTPYGVDVMGGSQRDRAPLFITTCDNHHAYYLPDTPYASVPLFEGIPQPSGYLGDTYAPIYFHR